MNSHDRAALNLIFIIILVWGAILLGLWIGVNTHKLEPTCARAVVEVVT